MLDAADLTRAVSGRLGSAGALGSCEGRSLVVWPANPTEAVRSPESVGFLIKVHELKVWSLEAWIEI